MREAPPAALLEFIRSGENFLVAGHKEPDGDCVGSQLALASLLGRLGKTALVCSAGPFKRPEVLAFADRFVSKPEFDALAGFRAIVVDCSQLDRVGDLAPCLAGLPSATIDHHATAAAFGDVVWINARAPSVTFMVLGVIEALGETPTADEAALLFFGLATDTGFFRHVDRHGAAAFSAAARMIEAGADPKAAFAAINGGKSLDSRRLLGLVLERTESHFGGKLLLSTELLEETERYGLQGRDSDMLYQLLQSVAGVEAVAVIRQETADNCTVGLRSRAGVDVSAIAARFGGGGHKQAAGLSVAGTIDAFKPRLIDAFGSVFCNRS
jgi:phosphoesterase RecJ-like protein